MELHEFVIKVRKRTTISIIPFADVHLGTSACDVDKFKELIKWVKDTPNVYLIGGGDYVEGINISDYKRFDPDMVASEYKDVLGRIVQHQVDDMVNILKPVRDRIIGLSWGNHERTVLSRYHYDVMMSLCGKLDVRCLGWASITRLKLIRPHKGGVASQVVHIFMEHGSGGGKKKGGKVNRLEDRSNDFDADIFIMAHTHDKIATTKSQLYVPRQGEMSLRERKRVYCICPSYYNTYRLGDMSYGERSGYSPTSTGVVRIDIIMKHSRTLDYLDYNLYQ